MSPLYQAVKKIAGVARDPLSLRPVVALQRRGLLVFSRHGGRAVENLRSGKLFSYGLGRNCAPQVLRSYASTGFGYSDYDARGAPGYGVSFTAPAWIRGTLERVGGFREVYFAETCWSAHHDIYGLVRAADGGGL
jgi:hypothetical protein